MPKTAKSCAVCGSFMSYTCSQRTMCPSRTVAVSVPIARSTPAGSVGARNDADAVTTSPAVRGVSMPTCVCDEIALVQCSRIVVPADARVAPAQRGDEHRVGCEQQDGGSHITPVEGVDLALHDLGRSRSRGLRRRLRRVSRVASLPVRRFRTWNSNSSTPSSNSERRRKNDEHTPSHRRPPPMQSSCRDRIGWTPSRLASLSSG